MVFITQTIINSCGIIQITCGTDRASPRATLRAPLGSSSQTTSPRFLSDHWTRSVYLQRPDLCCGVKKKWGLTGLHSWCGAQWHCSSQVWIIADVVPSFPAETPGVVCHRMGVGPMQPKGQSWDFGIGVSPRALKVQFVAELYLQVFDYVRLTGRMGAHQCEGKLSGSSSRRTSSACRLLTQPSPPAASNTSERERSGCVAPSHLLRSAPALFVPGSSMSTQTRSPEALHVKGMHNHITMVCIVVGLETLSMDECYSPAEIVSVCSEEGSMRALIYRGSVRQVGDDFKTECMCLLWLATGCLWTFKYLLFLYIHMMWKHKRVGLW